MTTELHLLDLDLITLLRSCRLAIGVEFVRCGKCLGHSEAHTMAQRLRDALGDSQDDVFAAYNPDTGHEDYVRVNRGTVAFQYICQMKS